MKKSLLISVLVLAASAAFGAEKTSVEFDLSATTYVKKNKEVKVTMSRLNAFLKKKKLEGLPSKVVVSTNPEAYWKVLMRRIEAANKVYKTELLFPINSGYLYEFPNMCYRGKTSEVPGVVKAMLGNFLTDEQGVHAIRYGKTKLVESDAFKDDKTLKEGYEDNAPEEVAHWLKYDEKSDAVLIMSDLGPQGDGTELYSTFVKRCAN